MKSRILLGILSFLSAAVLVAPAYAEPTVYVTADNGAGTNLFGTLNLETGRFTEIAQTTQLFYALTVGPGGRLYGADINTGSIFTIGRNGVTTPYGSVTAPGFQYGGTYGFAGLAFPRDDGRCRCRRGEAQDSRGGAARSEDDLLAVNVDPMHVSLYRIQGHGHDQTDLGVIEGPNTGIFFSGVIAFGPHGKLYFDFLPPSGAQLYSVDPCTGAPTPIGQGLGSDVLTLFAIGNELYGIDTDATSQIGIYRIDVETGLATATGVIVTGLPSTNDFYLDTVAYSPR